MEAQFLWITSGIRRAIALYVVKAPCNLVVGKCHARNQCRSIVMDKQLWTAVDDYTNALLVPADAALDAALAASEAAGLPPISVSPSQGKLLMLLAQLAGVTRILEIGTLGGYS